jgi:hypothetical protein
MNEGIDINGDKNCLNVIQEIHTPIEIAGNPGSFGLHRFAGRTAFS